MKDIAMCKVDKAQKCHEPSYSRRRQRITGEMPDIGAAIGGKTPMGTSTILLLAMSQPREPLTESRPADATIKTVPSGSEFERFAGWHRPAEDFLRPEVMVGIGTNAQAAV